MHKLASVIIPTYNRSSMIKRSINSALSQDYKPIEVIIVDDGSTDNTEEIVESFNDQRLQYIKLHRNQGISFARNKGLSVAKGEYIAFLDSDDEFLPLKLQAQVKIFEHIGPDAGMVFTNYWVIGKNKVLNVSKNKPTGYVNTTDAFPASVYAGPPAWMINRSLIDAIGGFDENLKTCEDLDFFAKAVRHSAVYFLNQPLANVFVHDSLEGNVPDTFVKETRERVLEKWLSEMKKDRNFLADFYCTMSKDLNRIGKKREAKEFLIKALNVKPFDARIIAKIVKMSFSSS